jgi:hypothetical protein
MEGHSEEVGPKLDSRPTLYADLQYHWDCFWQLNATRPSGFSGIERIKYAEMLAYIEINMIDDLAQRIRFCERITYLDSIFIDVYEELKPPDKPSSKEKSHG